MSALLPCALFALVLCAALRRADLYGAFVRGAKEGLCALVEMAPYLCAVFAASGLFRASGAQDALLALLSPPLGRLGVPAGAVPALLLRPLSGSAALAEAARVMREFGPDSRCARFVCTLCGASETVFFTGSLYFGAAGVRRTRYAIPAALCGYLAGACAALLLA